MTESETVARNLARNMRTLRDAHGWTQLQLSTRADVPRPTLANLESGGANPTLAVLVRVASALQVSLEELVGPPRDTGRHVLAKDLVRRSRTGVQIVDVIPDALPGFQVEQLTLPVGKGMRGAPHMAGTREYFFVHSGSVAVEASGTRWSVQAGDVAVFRGDQRHAYRNDGNEPAVGMSIVLLPPPGR